MRLDTAREETITNLGGSRKFSIAASAKAFQILSSGLYENKPEAIVRELGCNAFDSHVMADKRDVPFRLQLPTPINDFVFAVEDFGVGLSEDDVYNVYTTYFESTKTDSNDVIGALGLGSKTPFSYTDSFTVKSRKDGKEYVFSAHIGSSGEPEVQKMWERPWAGSNGVEVSVEIAAKDVHNFYAAAEKVFSWFEVKPQCNRDLNYRIGQSIVDNVRQYGYHLEQKSGFGSRLDCKVLMGNVSYDLDLQSIKSEDDDVTDKFISQLYSLKADIYFSVEIGDADVAASRETLSLDERTIQNLRDRIEHIRANFEQTTIQKVDKFENVIEAYRTLTPYERSVVKDYKINGWSIREFDNRRGQLRTSVSEAYGDDPEPEAVRVSNIGDEYDIAVFTDGSSFRAKPRSKRESSAYITDLTDMNDQVIVLINDCERKIGLKDAITNNTSLNRKVLVISDKKTVLNKDLEDYLNWITFNSFKVLYASSFWDGKLSAQKSSSGGLAEETIKSQIMKRGQMHFHNQKVDFSDEDKGNWAYVHGNGDFHRTLEFSDGTKNFVSDSEICKVMKELDLDGIIAYHGNNSKKVKRVFGEDRKLIDLIEEKASEDTYDKVKAYQELEVLHNEPYMIFEGYEAMHNTLKDAIDHDCKYCSLMRYERVSRGTKAGISQSIRNRIAVFEKQIEILKESSPILKEVLTGYRFNSKMIPEIKQFIKIKKGV